MTANELLARQLEREMESFLKTVKLVPEDKLDWVPQEGVRSARDQFQEVATIVGDHWEIYETRKMEWDQDKFMAYMERRKNVHTVADLEARLRQDTNKLIEFVRSLPASDLAAPTDMPFPGDHTVADNVTYHLWNMGYHEGQIAYLLQLMGIDPMPMPS